MKLIVGLGNVGKEYQNTRHNAGFIAVEFLANYHHISWDTRTTSSTKSSAKFRAELARGVVGAEKILLAKPVTYMNLSGQSVQALCSYYNIKLEDVFVIHDDIDLEIGRIKYKLGGGAGGHNGLKSLDQHIGNNYHRIRIGIGRPTKQDVASYVLAPFSKDQNEIIASSIQIITDNFPLLLLKEWENFKNEIAKITICNNFN